MSGVLLGDPSLGKQLLLLFHLGLMHYRDIVVSKFAFLLILIPEF